MNTYIERDDHARKAAVTMKWIYVLSGALIAIAGAMTGNMYRCFMGLVSLLVVPALAGIYRFFRLKPGWQLEIWVYVFAYLSITLGGCVDLYQKIHGFDKIAHMLSGAFTALLAFALYLYLEREHSIQSLSSVTTMLFVFFASMAVAALFEIGEFALAPIVGRDLQCVIGTGVTDTIVDMIVCLAGTVCALPLIMRFFRGRRNLFTDAAVAFYYKNVQHKSEPMPTEKCMKCRNCLYPE